MFLNVFLFIAFLAFWGQYIWGFKVVSQKHGIDPSLVTLLALPGVGAIVTTTTIRGFLAFAGF